MHRHPEYDNKTLVNDVAVLQLRSPVEFDDFVRPACIASSTPETNHYSECMVAGWGSLPAGIKPYSHHIKIASFDVNLICFSFRKFMNITKQKEELTFVTCLLSADKLEIWTIEKIIFVCVETGFCTKNNYCSAYVPKFLKCSIQSVK